MTADESATFGALLRRLRAAAGLTQEELAERAGLSRRGINDLERGTRLLQQLGDAYAIALGEHQALLRAARLLGAATEVRERLSTPSPASSQEDTKQAVAEARAAAFTAGNALSVEQAIVEALETT